MRLAEAKLLMACGLLTIEEYSEPRVQDDDELFHAGEEAIDRVVEVRERETRKGNA